MSTQDQVQQATAIHRMTSYAGHNLATLVTPAPDNVLVTSLVNAVTYARWQKANRAIEHFDYYMFKNGTLCDDLYHDETIEANFDFMCLSRATVESLLPLCIDQELVDADGVSYGTLQPGAIRIIETEDECFKLRIR